MKKMFCCILMVGAALLCSTASAWGQVISIHMDYDYTPPDGNPNYTHDTYFTITAKDEVSIGNGSRVCSISLYNCDTIFHIPATVTYRNKTYRVTGIASKAFYYMSNLKGVVLPPGIWTIGASAFENCGMNVADDIEPQDVVLPSELMYLGKKSFYNCYWVKSIDLSQSGVTSIPDDCFGNMRNLASVNLGSKVRTIGVGAFEGSRLKELTIPEQVTIIRADAFRSNELETVTFEGNRVWLDTIPKTTEPSGYTYTFSQQLVDNGATAPDMYNVPFWLSYHFTAHNGYHELTPYMNFYITMDKPVRTFSTTLSMEFDADAYADGLRVYTVAGIDAANSRVVLRPIEPTTAGHLLLYGSECYVLSGTAGHRYNMQRENTAWQARSASYLMGDGKVVVNPLGQLSSAQVQPTETRGGVQYTNMTLVDGKFVALTAATYLPAGEAYLSVPTSEIETIIENSSGAPQLTIAIGDFDDNGNGGTTSAGAADYLRPAGSPSVYYDLNGHRLEQPRKGINIVNGKKVIIK